MEPFMKFMLWVIGFLVISFIVFGYLYNGVPTFDITVAPPQSVIFDPNTCTDIIENPITETIWGDVSNGYRCGHE